MFGSLASRYFRRRAGRFPSYRSRGLRRFRYRGPRLRKRRTRNIRSANRAITTVHRIEQYNGGSGQYAIDLISGTLDVHKHVAPLVSEFPGTGPFKNLYHQFKVRKVILEFFPVNQQGRYNTFDTTEPSDLYTPTLYTAVNRTSSNFADNITKICSCNSMRSVTAGRYMKRVFTPCTLDQVYESAITTSYNPEFNQWISTDHTSTPNFGMDILLSSTDSPKQSFKYKMRITIVCQWKNRKPNIDLS